MHLEDQEINEFIKLWEEEFGERLSPDEARLRAIELLELFAHLLEQQEGGSFVSNSSRSFV